MKRTQLLSILHNYANSLSSGLGIAIGYVVTDVYGDAERTPEKSLTVDFLEGTIDGNASNSLRETVATFKDGFPEFCARRGASVDDFKSAKARYSIYRGMRRFTVSITDKDGRSLSADYDGTRGRRIREVDAAGRFRRRAYETGNLC